MLPTAYRIRDLTIAPNVLLAPMEGVTDLPFRRLIRRMGGCGLTTTEFVPGAGLLRGDKKLQRMVEFDPDERPVAIQIYGRDPTAMAEGARMVEDLGATLCDINMGCPSKKVCNHSGGSGLMREPELAIQIVRAVRQAISIPLTVKMRSGFDAEHRNAPELAWAAQEEGADAITIHWRTRADRYGGVRQVDRIAATKARLRIPVVGNGDIVDVQSARAMLRETGCDGVMVGRGAMRRPWVLREIAASLADQPVPVISVAERRAILFGWLEETRAWIGLDMATLGKLKQVAKHFVEEELPGGGEARLAILRSGSIEEAVGHIEGWFSLLERCAA